MEGQVTPFTFDGHLRALQLRIGEARAALQAADRLAMGSSIKPLVDEARSALFNAETLLSKEIGEEEVRDHPVHLAWQRRK